MFYTCSRGESSAKKRRRNNSVTKKVGEDELKVIKGIKEELNETHKIIKGKSSEKRNIQERKVDQIKIEIDDELTQLKGYHENNDESNINKERIEAINEIN